MASWTKGDERDIERCAHSGQNRTNSPPSASSHPLDGGDGGKPGMLEEWKVSGFDDDSSLETQP